MGPPRVPAPRPAPVRRRGRDRSRRLARGPAEPARGRPLHRGGGARAGRRLGRARGRRQRPPRRATCDGAALHRPGSRGGDGAGGHATAGPRPSPRADGRGRVAVPTARPALRPVPAVPPVHDPRSARRRGADACRAVQGLVPRAARPGDGRAARRTGPAGRPRRRGARVARRRRPRPHQPREGTSALRCRGGATRGRARGSCRAVRDPTR